MKNNRKKSVQKTRSSFGDLYKRNRRKESPKQYWGGIINKSVGFVYGTAKSGKTIICENLAFAIVCGRESFLGVPIELPKSKVLYISMEEDTDMRMIQRGRNQIKGFSREERKLIRRNLSYSDEGFIRSVSTNRHWELLENEIRDYKSNLIFVDSTNRFVYDIEQKMGANEMLLKFRELASKYDCAIVLIHHAIKSQTNQGLSLDKMSGSSALSRDADYFIGINYLSNGTRYLKFVDGRYYPSSDKCKVISIQNNYLINLESEEYESNLFKTMDDRYNNDNTNKVIEFIKENVNENGLIETKLLQSKLVDTKDNDSISKGTLFSQLKKLVESEIIIKDGHGKYKLIKDNS
jgi:RecA-family ATPase